MKLSDSDLCSILELSFGGGGPQGLLLGPLHLLFIVLMCSHFAPIIQLQSYTLPTTSAEMFFLVRLDHLHISIKSIPSLSSVNVRVNVRNLGVQVKSFLNVMGANDTEDHYVRFYYITTSVMPWIPFKDIDQRSINRFQMVQDAAVRQSNWSRELRSNYFEVIDLTVAAHLFSDYFYSSRLCP